jgi:hypothetical protein
MIDNGLQWFTISQKTINNDYNDLQLVYSVLQSATRQLTMVYNDLQLVKSDLQSATQCLTMDNNDLQ